jgi:hypothetical protein
MVFSSEGLKEFELTRDTGPISGDDMIFDDSMAKSVDAECVIAQLASDLFTDNFDGLEYEVKRLDVTKKDVLGNAGDEIFVSERDKYDIGEAFVRKEISLLYVGDNAVDDIVGNIEENVRNI